MNLASCRKGLSVSYPSTSVWISLDFDSNSWDIFVNQDAGSRGFIVEGVDVKSRMSKPDFFKQRTNLLKSWFHSVSLKLHLDIRIIARLESPFVSQETPPCGRSSLGCYHHQRGRSRPPARPAGHCTERNPRWSWVASECERSSNGFVWHPEIMEHKSA